LVNATDTPVSRKFDSVVSHTYVGDMTRTLETKLHIDNWDEKPYRELPDGRKFTRAEVQLTGTAAEGFGSAAFEALMYYRADGTGTYVTLMSLDATLDGRSGGIV